MPLAAESQVPAEAQWHAAGVADPARGKRVLVIGDDALVLDGMRGILQYWGFLVETAASGAVALAGLFEGGASPDLIISDCSLANGDRLSITTST